MSPSLHADSPSLDTFGIFSHLSPEQRRQIESIALLKRYAKGEIVFYEGDESRYFHVLVEGETAVFKSSASDETILIHRFRAPSLIAEVATLKQIPYPASCECTTSGVIIKIPRDSFIALLQNDPSLSIALIASLTQKIAALEHSLERHSAPNAMAKVARLIREDAQSIQKQKGVDIARFLGITPETLSRTIKKLKAEGVITVSKSDGVTIRLPDILNTYCG